MTIKYKFNKSDNSRNCIVNRIELEIIQENFITSNNLGIKLLEIDKQLNPSWYIEQNLDINNLTEKELLDFVKEIIINQDNYKGWRDPDYLYNNHFICTFNNYSIKGEYSEYGEYKVKCIIEYTRELKQFILSSELIAYLQTINEETEFITDNALDEVLLREWIGNNYIFKIKR